jgi:cellobiose dehydrogenase (acceptor)
MLNYFFLALTLLSTVSASPLYPRLVNNASSVAWDYIVAGAGPAGIIVAERLAEKNYSVILLEGGGPSTFSTGGTASPSWNATGYTVYDIASQDAQIFTSGATHLCTDTAGLAACLLGGGVEINALVFVPPAEHDFNDKWPAGWKWTDIESSANALYARNPPTITPSTDGKIYDTAEFSMLGGLLKTLNFTEVDPITSPNSKFQVYAHPPTNVQNGERGGPVRSYLPLAQNMTNFSLQLYTKVLQVVRTNGRATGVLVQDSQTGVQSIINVNSKGRVVLAAGSMSSPRILINSGIGPADQIAIVANGTQNITVPPVHEHIHLPVGTIIKDHPIINLYFNTTDSLSLYPFATPYAADQASYLANRTGVLAQGLQRLIFWSSFIGDDNITRYIQGTTSVYAANNITIKMYLTHGLTSVGKLGITSSGTTELITKPYFTTKADINGMASYIDSFLAAVRASNILVPSSNATGAELLVSELVQGDHYVGTCKIGTDDGRNGGEAVVDIDTKVYGTENLFVVDASIHADLPTGNTQAIVMVVAEKAAERILSLQM